MRPSKDVNFLVFTSHSSSFFSSDISDALRAYVNVFYFRKYQNKHISFQKATFQGIEEIIKKTTPTVTVQDIRGMRKYAEDNIDPLCAIIEKEIKVSSKDECYDGVNYMTESCCTIQ